VISTRQNTQFGIGAAGVQFQILAPTVTDISVSVNLTLREGVSIAGVENEVISAISGYVNSLGVGEDIIIERIRSAVINIKGISDVVLTSPTANISIADNELGRVKTNNILVG